MLFLHPAYVVHTSHSHSIGLGDSRTVSYLRQVSGTDGERENERERDLVHIIAHYHNLSTPS